MADPETFPEIPSPSSGSFKTLEDDGPSTPMRTGTPTPTRHVDERSKLLDHSGDDVFVEYNAERTVERRRQPSTYSVINTGTTSRVNPDAVPRLNDDDDDGEPNVSYPLYLAMIYSMSILGMHIAGPPGTLKPEVSKFPTGNWRKRISYYVPVTSWIPGYSWSLYVFPCFYTFHSSPRWRERDHS